MSLASREGGDVYDEALRGAAPKHKLMIRLLQRRNRTKKDDRVGSADDTHYPGEHLP